MTSGARAILPGEFLDGKRISLRLIGLADCTTRYEAWLADPMVNQYLETRWRPQPLESIREFVAGMLESRDSYLFAIIETAASRHIGNIKVGPINPNHGYADISYFLGEKDCWGKGYATEAIRIATAFAFTRLGLDRMQAGLYASNAGSGKALEKAGYRLEGIFRKQLKNAQGVREDHSWYGLLKEDWKAQERHRE